MLKGINYCPQHGKYQAQCGCTDEQITATLRQALQRPAAVSRSEWMGYIDDAISEAYDLGHTHGTNPFRQFQGEQPRRVDEGWEKIAEKLFKESLRLCDSLSSHAPKAEEKKQSLGEH